MKNLIQFLAIALYSKARHSNDHHSKYVTGNRMFATLLLTGMFFSTNVTAANEEYYTWVDENGITNYAERNPEGVNATFVSPNHAFGRRLAEREAERENEGRPQGSRSLPSSQTEEVDPDALVDENAAALAAKLAAQKRTNCEAGKNNLAQLKAFARIRVADDNGEERVLTDEEKEAKAEEARQVIRENCSA